MYMSVITTHDTAKYLIHCAHFDQHRTVPKLTLLGELFSKHLPPTFTS